MSRSPLFSWTSAPPLLRLLLPCYDSNFTILSPELTFLLFCSAFLSLSSLEAFLQMTDLWKNFCLLVFRLESVLSS